MSEIDPTDIEGQRLVKQKAKDEEKLRKQVEADDVRWLMGDKRGRRIMWRLLEKTGLYRSSFTGTSQTFFNEGMRNIGLMLMAEIHEFAPEQYAVMLKEQKQNERNADDRARKH
jgi:hypothetical protein